MKPFIRKQALNTFLIFFSRFLHSMAGVSHACRFHPTCREYFIEAVEKFGFIKGFYLGTRRLLHCHPWGKWGIDAVLEEGNNGV